MKAKVKVSLRRVYLGTEDLVAISIGDLDLGYIQFKISLIVDK